MNIVSLLESNATEKDYHQIFANCRWGGMPDCKKCKNEMYYWVSSKRRFRCSVCKTEISTTARTMMHATRLPLKTWFQAIHLILSSKKGISSLQLARILKVNKNTAWYLQYRIREGMKYREVLKILRQLYPTGKLKFGSKRRHRNRLRPRKPEFSRSNEMRYGSPKQGTKNMRTMQRAIAGQYHQLGEFHYSSYDDEITFRKVFYKPMIFYSLLTGLCSVE